MTLFVREGDRIVPAPEEDQATLSSYPQFEDKGPEIGGYRLTLLTARPTAAVGEPVRIVHVCESTGPGAPLYVMGPKAVLGEYVDDQLAGSPAPATRKPLAPDSYDGRVLPGPGVDANYEITEHRFDAPGRHSVQWRLGDHVSNTLWVEVT
jgi:hypothetical protein